MKKSVLFLIVMMCAVCAFSQRVNEKGQKLVSKLSMKWYDDATGNFMDYISWDVSFIYDDRGNLVGLDKVYNDAGATYTEKYRKDKRVINGTVYKNGKLLPHNRILIEPHKYRVEDYVTYNDDGHSIAYYNKDVWNYYYNALGVCRTSKEEFIGEKIEDAKWSAEQFFQRLDFTKFDESVDMDERAWGFIDKTGGMYATKDSLIYLSLRTFNDRHNSSMSMSHTYMDGNMQNCYDVNDKGNILHENIYSDRLNDTNIEFYGFSQIGKSNQTVYGNIEWGTEWMKTRSKNLLLMENRRYAKGKNYEEWLKEHHPERYDSEMKPIYKNWKSMCLAKWDYNFDGSGNIRKIVIDYNINAFGITTRKCIIDLEYLY